MDRQRRRRRKLRFQALEARLLLAAQPIVTEFLASNDDGLLDDNGNSTDWIEIFNAGDESVDLAGYTLTDDPALADKWTFPSVTLPAQEFLVVFAGTDENPSTGTDLYTGFGLNSSGEYLGFYDPASAPLTEFGSLASEYPEQRSDVSYGYSFELTVPPTLETIFDYGSQASILVPSDNSVDAIWRERSFNDSSWLLGPTPVGYEASAGGTYEDLFSPAGTDGFDGVDVTDDIPGTPDRLSTVYLRYEFNIQDRLAVNKLLLDLQFEDGFIAYLNGVQVESFAAPTNPAFNSSTLGNANRGADLLALDTTTFTIDGNDLSPLRSGFNVLAVHMLNASATSSDLLFNARLIAEGFSSAELANPLDEGYLQTPTPGAANVESVEGFVEPVSFSVDRGFYNDPIQVAITTPTVGASVYYTTDFSLPAPTNPTATLYNGAVTVDKTTTLRAVAHLEDFAPSYIDTSTYVFVEDVLIQDPRDDNGNGASPDNGLAYPSKVEGNIDADYALDPEVVTQWDDNNPANTDIGIRESLLSLPSFSLTLEHGDAFRPDTDPFPGIITNARNRGENFRHAASIEYFDPATGEQFQANAAVQAQGNSSRGTGSTRQHSYRLIFNQTLGGPGKLNFPLFDNSDFADINTFTLKVASTDGFSHDSRTNGSTINPLNSTYTRDAYIRQLQFNTGNPAADSTFAHVYINGLYWGLYTPIERPDDAFFSDRFGGQREDWDIFRDNDEFISGNSSAWNQMTSLISSIGSSSSSQADNLFQQLQGRNNDGSVNPSIEPLMDVDNFIDYYAIHMSSNTNDWPHRNWYAARNRIDPGKGFQFLAWDQGQSLAQDFIDRTERQGGLGTLHRRLRNSPEYRLRFADRIQEHFFNDGALTLAAKQQTWADLSATAEPAIVAETARWGDSREGEFSNAFGTSNPPSGAPQHPLYPPGFATTVPTLTIDNWRVNSNFVHDEVLPFGRGVFFDRMVVDGLWIDNVAAPSFSINGTAQHGGVIAAGSSLGIGGTGTVYFTTDGSDPRAVGGGIAGTAFSSPFDLDSTTVVNARSFSGGQWSPLTKATFAIASNSIAFSEIDYHPSEATPAELATLGVASIDSDEFEFIEVVNFDPASSINLLDFELRSGLEFTFGDATLAPGETAVIVENQEAFEARYGMGVNVIGQWTGGLSNNSDTIELFDATDTLIDAVTYSDSSPWPVAADGDGPALTRVGPTMDGNSPTSWIAEQTTPGTADFTPQLAGDYDRNGTVEQNDYTVWRENFGSNLATNADGNSDGTVNMADYTIWRDNLGATLPAGGSVANTVATAGSQSIKQILPPAAIYSPFDSVNAAVHAAAPFNAPSVVGINDDELLLAIELNTLADIQGALDLAMEVSESDESDGDFTDQYDLAFEELYSGLS